MRQKKKAKEKGAEKTLSGSGEIFKDNFDPSNIEQQGTERGQDANIAAILAEVDGFFS